MSAVLFPHSLLNICISTDYLPTSKKIVQLKLRQNLLPPTVEGGIHVLKKIQASSERHFLIDNIDEWRLRTRQFIRQMSNIL